MNKGLDALNKIRFLIDFIQLNDEKTVYYLNTIETALKENETLKKLYKAELKNTSYYNNLALKYKKALEIIKREPSEVIEIITTYDSWEEYIKDYPISDKTIWHIINNKNEFDLLKGYIKEDTL